MAKTPLSLLLRLSQAQKPSPSPSLLLLRSHVFSLRPFSTSPPTPYASDSSGPPPARSSLSARMSFVFDQIDAIERDRSHKDEALQRIRAWRDAKAKNNDTKDEHHPPVSEPEIGNGVDSNANRDRGGLLAKEVELVHPWKEWVELMERLVQQNYFDHRRKDEDGMVRDLGLDMSGVSEEVLDFTRDFKTVQAACLNFGRDRFDIMRSLSRQDIQLLVGYGCPTVDKKVVFSAKLLRKHVHLDEGDVCSSCALRSSCERAYLVTNKEDEARTFDVMRILLTFGFDPVNGLVANKALLKLKSVKNAVRKMLHEVVKLSGVPIDPNLPPPIIRKPPPKVKQPPPPPRKRVGRDDIEMKKGDWLCPKCDFMNFAKNTVCLQCDAKRPKRQLLPGEWECPECNFLNYRRNTACFHCECKRPPDEYTENFTQERQHFPKMRTERVANRQEVSNSWNFDFDDAESDGADVAAFEYADSPRMDEQLDGPAQGGGFRESGDTFHQGSRSPRSLERDFPNPDHKKPRVGFDDFDDEDDDDVDSYELDSRNSTPVHTDSFNEFPEARRYSESEDFYGSGDELHSRRRMSSSSNGQFKQPRRKAPFSGSEDDFGVVDSDEDLPVHPNWKSSHVADFGRRSRGGRTGGSSRRMNFSSEEEHGLSSGSNSDLGDDFPSRRGKGNKWGFNRRGTMRGGSNFEDEHSYGSDSNDKRFRGNRAGPNTRGSPQNGRESFGSSRHTQFRSDNKMENRGKFSNDNFDRSHKGAYGNDRGHRGGAYDNDRGRRGDSYSGGRFDDGNGRGHRGGSYGSGRGHNCSRGRFDDDGGRNYSRDRPQRHAFDRDSERGYRGSNRGGREFVDRDNDYGRDRPQRRMAER